MPGATAVWKPRVGQLLPSLEEATAVAVTVVTIVESGNQGYSQGCVLMLLPCMMQDARFTGTLLFCGPPSSALGHNVQ